MIAEEGKLCDRCRKCPATVVFGNGKGVVENICASCFEFGLKRRLIFIIRFGFALAVALAGLVIFGDYRAGGSHAANGLLPPPSPLAVVVFFALAYLLFVGIASGVYRVLRWKTGE